MESKRTMRVTRELQRFEGVSDLEIYRRILSLMVRKMTIADMQKIAKMRKVDPANFIIDERTTDVDKMLLDELTNYGQIQFEIVI
tara:strand:- start:165 stop:419 length:255 start_codon:yes stop_codon:yes gene_type:complete